MAQKSKSIRTTNHLAVRLFVPFAIVFGLAMTFLTPPFQAPDEPTHFFRAYQVSDLDFVPAVKDNFTGGYLPQSLFKTFILLDLNNPENNEKLTSELIDSALNVPLEKEKKSFLMFSNTALYTPVLYFPQATGIFIGKLFNLPPIVLLYLARIFNLGFWILLMYTSIKWMPFNKWLIAALSITPMAVFLAGSVNADALVMAYPFLFMAYILKVTFEDGSGLDRKNLLILTFLSILVALSKNIYVLMSALIFIIPASKAKGRTDYLVKVSAIYGLTLLAAAISYFMVQNTLSKIEVIELYYGGAPLPLINPDKQIEFILSDIPGFLSMVFFSFFDNITMILKAYVGILGWLKIIFTNTYYFFAFLVLLTFAIFGEQKKLSLGVKQKTLMILILLITLLAFSFTMYCSWCEPGAPHITNLQGRYFIPIAPLGLLLFQNKKIVLTPGIFSLIFIVFASFSMVLSVRMLLLYYYF